MAASPEILQGPEPTEVQSFPTVPAQEVQTKQTTETHVAIPSKAQPLCTTLNKSQPVENNITRAGRSVVKATWLFKGLCLTTPVDCRR